MKNISKKIFLNALTCPTMGWLMRSGTIAKTVTTPTLGEKFRIEQGREIGEKARELYPHGILIDDKDIRVKHSIPVPRPNWPIATVKGPKMSNYLLGKGSAISYFSERVSSLRTGSMVREKNQTRVQWKSIDHPICE